MVSWLFGGWPFLLVLIFPFLIKISKAFHLKHFSFWHSPHVRPIFNDLVHAVAWQCMFAFLVVVYCDFWDNTTIRGQWFQTLSFCHWRSRQISRREWKKRVTKIMNKFTLKSFIGFASGQLIIITCLTIAQFFQIAKEGATTLQRHSA